MNSLIDGHKSELLYLVGLYIEVLFCTQDVMVSVFVWKEQDMGAAENNSPSTESQWHSDWQVDICVDKSTAKHQSSKFK